MMASFDTATIVQSNQELVRMAITKAEQELGRMRHDLAIAKAEQELERMKHDLAMAKAGISPGRPETKAPS